VRQQAAGSRQQAAGEDMTDQIVRTYRDLVVWQEALDLVEACYRLTAKFPRDELYGLSAQIRRSAASIPANIAEGYGRDATGSYLQFLKIARGSLRELETHLLVAERVELAAKDVIELVLARCDKVGRLLHGLLKSLQRSTGDA
jgi:four helix bundle protein